MAPLYESLSNIPDTAKGCALAIGNFDGVHLGHRALLTSARDVAKTIGRPAAALTFEPHPREFFKPGGAPFRLTLLPAKHRLLSAQGMDHVFAIAFDQSLAALTAEEFIRDILVSGLGARHIVVGADFAFGRDRGGNAETLREAARRGQFDLTVVDSVAGPDGEVYSSTRIRSLLHQGKFTEAAAVLGDPWQIEAEVVHGDGRGRGLGFPTANQRVSRYLRPPYGVYAVRALLEGETQWRDGAANFGIRPMFRIEEPIFETYLFDFDLDIYGKKMRVQPVSHLRPGAV